MLEAQTRLKFDARLQQWLIKIVFFAAIQRFKLILCNYRE